MNCGRRSAFGGTQNIGSATAHAHRRHTQHTVTHTHAHRTRVTRTTRSFPRIMKRPHTFSNPRGSVSPLSTKHIPVTGRLLLGEWPTSSTAFADAAGGSTILGLRAAESVYERARPTRVEGVTCSSERSIVLWWGACWMLTPDPSNARAQTSCKRNKT